MTIRRKRNHSWLRTWLVLALAGAVPVLAWAFLLTQPLEEASSIRPLPWRVGEHLTYEVRLGLVPAGSQSLMVVDESIDNGSKVYQLRSDAVPSAFLSKVYAFYDHRTSFISQEDLLPIRYLKDVEDGGYRAEYVVEFDRRHERATVWKDGAFDRDWDVPAQVHDELSMIYFLRSKNLRVGDTYRYTVFTGRKLVPVEVSVLSRVYFQAPEPLGKVSVFRLRASDGLVVWITDDAHRMPVKIEVPVKVFGTLAATLRSIHGLMPTESAR